MTLALVSSSSRSSRLESLMARKADVEAQLSERSRYLSSSDQELRQLKKVKLQLKEEIEGIRRAS
jgi:hypothetical protein